MPGGGADKTAAPETISNFTFDIKIYFEIFSIKYSDKFFGKIIITSSPSAINCMFTITFPW